MAALTPLLSHMTASSVLERKFIYNFTYHELLCRTISAGIFVWYLLSKVIMLLFIKFNYQWLPHF